MNEERMAILRMVSEGKITTDEAEALLKSLGSEKKTDEPQPQERRRGKRRGPRPPRPPKPPKPPRGFRRPDMGNFDMGNFADGMNEFAQEMSQFAHNVAGDVIHSVRDNFDAFDREFEEFDENFDVSPQTIEIEPNTTLIIKSNDGSVMLLGTDEPTLSISGAPKMHYKVHRQGNRVEIKSKRFATTLIVHVPRNVQQLNVKTQLSSVVAEDLMLGPQDIQIQTQVGSVDLNLGIITDGRILVKTQVGNVKLAVSEQAAFDFKASKTMGNIDVDMPLADVTEGNGYLMGSYNGGGAKIRVASQVGGIQLGVAELQGEEVAG